MNPAPEFYSTDQFDQIYLARHALVAETAARTRARTGPCPAEDDQERVALFGVDCQIGFCHPEASLFVPGAPGDMRRATEFLYRNLFRITTTVFSMDTHRAFQVFHPGFWSDADGNPPAPMTAISAADVESGRWRPAVDTEMALTYCRSLEATGKYMLTIWPYHTMLGAIDHALVPPVFEAALFHSLVRDSPTRFETKGYHPLTENYSVLEPEVKAIGSVDVGEFNRGLFDLLNTHDRVYVFGEAASHCVLATLDSLAQELKRTDPAALGQLYVLSDCTSPVPAVCDPSGEPIEGLDFPRVAREGLERLASMGVNVVSSTEEW